VELFSWIFWGVWALVGLGYEIYAVLSEKRSGALPLTRVVRDRLARRSVLLRLALLLGIAWLALHWLVPLPW
jgi:hypothetical protein